MLVDDKVGYVQLSPVSETSASELTEAVGGLVQKGMKSLILDLRGNPGGLLDQGVAVSELFLDPGQEVVSTRGRTPNITRSFRDTKPQPWPALPIVTLVNSGTASAAEIITGALQDHDRALVVGTPTFGKGLVQSLWQLTPETALKLTTARWYTPSGRTIQRVSEPTFSVSDEMVSEVLRRLRARGAAVPDSVTAGARTLIAQELGYELARYVFGRPAEVRRRMAEDHQVQAALALARRARSPQDLLSLAPVKAPTSPHN